MNLFQLKKALISIGVYNKKRLDFYSMLQEKDSINTNNKYYRVEALISLSILIGESTKSEKIKLLYETYSIKGSRGIGKENIIRLLNDLLFISLKAIPESCLLLNDNCKTLKIYVSNIESSFQSFFHQSVNEILEKKDEMEFEEFKNKFKNSFIKKLLSPSKSRKLAYKIHAIQLASFLN